MCVCVCVCARTHARACPLIFITEAHHVVTHWSDSANESKGPAQGSLLPLSPLAVTHTKCMPNLHIDGKCHIFDWRVVLLVQCTLFLSCSYLLFFVPHTLNYFRTICHLKMALVAQVLLNFSYFSCCSQLIGLIIR